MYAGAYYGGIGYGQIPSFVASVIVALLPTIAEALESKPNFISTHNDTRNSQMDYIDNVTQLDQEPLQLD